MLLSPRKNGLTSLFLKKVRPFFLGIGSVYQEKALLQKSGFPERILLGWHVGRANFGTNFFFSVTNFFRLMVTNFLRLMFCRPLFAVPLWIAPS